MELGSLLEMEYLRPHPRPTESEHAFQQKPWGISSMRRPERDLGSTLYDTWRWVALKLPPEEGMVSWAKDQEDPLYNPMCVPISF